MKFCSQVLSILLFGSSLFAQEKKTISKLNLLNEFDVPYNFTYQNTSVGGLSGIDYNPAANEYYLICDDRSVINPVRYYTTKINVSNNKIDTVVFTNKTTLHQPNGSVYPSSKTDPLHSPDPEAIRYNATGNYLVWTSEGERILKQGDTILQNPAINCIDKSGTYTGSFPLPAQFVMNKTENGPRQNGVFEGVCFANNNKTMYVTTEAPLYQDGPAAGLHDTTAWVRILKYNVSGKKLQAQYAYKLESIANEPNPADGFKVNGIVDILAVNDDEFLITERSYSTGVKNCTIKIFKCRFSNATDVKKVSSLKLHPPKKMVEKQLLLNMDSLGIYIDNIEGATFGPRLSNGHNSIVFVSDNDFLSDRKTQFMLFEVLP